MSLKNDSGSGVPLTAGRQQDLLLEYLLESQQVTPRGLQLETGGCLAFLLGEDLQRPSFHGSIRRKNETHGRAVYSPDFGRCEFFGEPRSNNTTPSQLAGLRRPSILLANGGDLD